MTFDYPIYPRGFAPRAPLHALSRAAAPARAVRVARSWYSLARPILGVQVFSRSSRASRRRVSSTRGFFSSGRRRKTADDFSQARVAIAGEAERNDPARTEL